jgi:WD40 repeat protein
VRFACLSGAGFGAVLLAPPALSAQAVLKAVGRPMEHPGFVRTIVFSPDSKKLFARTESNLGTATALWDVGTTRLIGQILVKPAQIRESLPITSMAFTPDGKRLVVLAGSCYLQRWDAARARPLAAPIALVPITAPQSQTMTGPVAFRSDFKAILVQHYSTRRNSVSGTRPRFARQPTRGFLVHPVTGRRLVGPLVYMKGKYDPKADVAACAFTPDGKQVLTLHKDGQVRFWDGATGKRKKMTLQHPEQSGAQLHIAPDGKTLAAVGSRGKVQLWDLATGKALGPPLAGAAACTVAYRPDGRALAFYDSSDREIEVRAVPTLKVQTRFRQEATVRELAFSPDGKTLVSVAEDSPILLWDPATGKQKASVKRQGQYTHTAAFSPDGKLIATAFSDGVRSKVQLWRLP